jgi:hypothetical protein
MNESIDFKGNDLLLEDFYEAEEIINKYVSKHLTEKLWNDEDLVDWMKKREFGEDF